MPHVLGTHGEYRPRQQNILATEENLSGLPYYKGDLVEYFKDFAPTQSYLYMVPVLIEDMPPLFAGVGKDMLYDASLHFYAPKDSVYSLYNAPNWMKIDSITGDITGVPPKEDFSTVIKVWVQNSYGTIKSNLFSIYSVDLPVYNNIDIENKEFILGVPVAFDISHHFSTNILTQYELYGEPNWMSVDTKGLVTGIPDVINDPTDMYVIAKNAAGEIVSNTFSYITKSAIYLKDKIDNILIDLKDSILVYDTAKHFETNGVDTKYELYNAPSYIDMNKDTGEILILLSGEHLIEDIIVIATNFTGIAISNQFDIEYIKEPVFRGVIPNIETLTGEFMSPFDISNYFEGKYLHYTLRHTPKWLDIDNNGVITGKSDIDACVIGVIVVVENIAGMATSNTFNIVTTSIPVFSGVINDKQGVLGKPIYPFDSSDNFVKAGIPRTYDLVGAPDWMTISKFGVFGGVPDKIEKKEGIQIEGINSRGSDLSNPFSMTIIDRPIFSSIIKDMFVKAYEEMKPIDISYHFSTGSNIKEYRLHGAPDWMNIDHTGKIRGTPDNYGITSGITITAVDYSGDISVSNEFSMKASAAPIFTGTIPDIITISDGEINNYDVIHHFSTGSLPSNYRLENEPYWMDISKEGVFSGVPEYEGTYQIMVTGFNMAGEATSNVFTLEVIDKPEMSGVIPNIEVAINVPIDMDIFQYFMGAGTPTEYEFMESTVDWLHLDNSGRLTGTPDTFFSSCTITIKASNLAGSVISNMFSMNVVKTPVMTGVFPNMLLEVNKEMIPYDVYQHFNRNNGAMLFELHNAPDWMALDMDALVGMPDTEEISRDIYISATNEAGITNSNTFSIRTIEAPEFAGTIPNLAFEVDEYINNIDFSIYFANGGNVKNYNLLHATYGLDINNKGILYGRVLKEMILEDVQVIAINDIAQDISNKFELVFTQQPAISGNIPNITVKVDTPMKKDVSKYFIGGGRVKSYTLENAPFWMSIDDKGRISGTPEYKGLATDVVVIAHNDIGQIRSKPFDIDIIADLPLFTGTLSNMWATVDDSFSYNISHHFMDGGTILRYMLINEPHWMKIDNTGVITGTPLDIHEEFISGIVIRAKNDEGYIDSNPFSMNVISAPIFKGPIGPILKAVVDSKFSLDISDHFIRDGDKGVPTVYNLSNEPDWLNITTTGILLGIPNMDAIASNIFITGMNAAGLAYSKSFQIDSRRLPIFDSNIADIYANKGQDMSQLNIDITKYLLPNTTIDKFEIINGPVWLSITSNGILEGIAIKIGDFEGIQITTENYAGIAASNFFNIHIKK